MATAGPISTDRLSGAALARLLALALPVALLGGALLSQYVGGLHPCEMCYWQRWPHGVAIVVAALAFLFAADSRNARLLVALAAIAIAISGAIGVFHAGVELKYWEGLTRCSTGGALTLDELMKVPLVRCDQVQFSFLGVSMAGWNAILSLGGAGAIVYLLRRHA
ncbi:disulfide bond formation protein B [Sphingomonas sp.]|uniref:disulfide bond formation protein B n=1 Tax=Sphingomonas sp. TaxID=28214 RepID=UPI00286D01CF|nr:disulfide bond formation protein B [Sphingomonas sp.]